MEQDLRDWLDELVFCHKHINKIRDLSEEIRICTYGTSEDNKLVIHIFKGLEKIASALNLELYKEKDSYVFYKYNDVLLLGIKENGELM